MLNEISYALEAWVSILGFVERGRILTELRKKRGQLAFSLLRRNIAPTFFGGKGSSPRFLLLLTENP